ncbi:restriction endonuclease subunit S [Filifactor alocis]
MSKIDELLKNEKVEWKKLGEIGEIFGGITGKTKNDFKNGNKKFVTYKNVYSNPALDLDIKDLVNIGKNENQRTLEFGDIIFTGSSETPDECGLSSVVTEIPKEQLYLNSFCFFLRPKNKILLPNFSKHLFRSDRLRKEISKTASGVTRFNVSKELMKKIEIPIPSLETQEKIVKILDKFTNYVTELQARTNQYQYYRDMLLSEESLTKISEQLFVEANNSIYYEKISNLCLRQKGINITAKEMKELDKENGAVKIFAGGNTVARVDVEDIGEEHIINKHSVIVKSRGNIDFEYYDNPFSHKNEMWSYSTLNDNILNIKFLYYVLKSNLKYFLDNSISGKLPQISIGITDNYKIPVPSIEIQNKVVEILDKFQSLLADTKGLLPQEIEQRQKQYEYYREKLLTFDTVCDNTHTHTRIVLSNRYFAILQEAAEFVGIKQSCVVWKKLEEISIYSKERISTDNLNECNYVGVENLLKDKLGKTKSSYVPKDGTMIKFCINDILIGNIRPYLRKIWMADVDGGTNGDVLVIHIKEDMNKVVLPKYLFQVLLDERFFEYDIKYSKGAKMPRGDKNKILEYKIPIPSLPVQEYIVSILDKFDALVNDISQGLPKEIELRQKQYEYYREKLLSFE